MVSQDTAQRAVRDGPFHFLSPPDGREIVFDRRQDNSDIALIELHSVLIVDRNVPIARLERVESAGRGAERITKLIADGTLRPATRRLSAKQMHAALAVKAAGAGVLDALLAQRADDR